MLGITVNDEIVKQQQVSRDTLHRLNEQCRNVLAMGLTTALLYDCTHVNTVQFICVATVMALTSRN